jgi:hypothetical protein
MASNPREDAKQFADKYKGNRWRISDEAADLFQCGESVPIKFYANPKKLQAYLIESYEDYLQELKIVEYKNGIPRWVKDEIVPIAAVAGDDPSDSSFFEDATGFLLYDGAAKTFIYANSDEWSLDNRIKSLKELGLHEGDGDDEESD